MAKAAAAKKTAAKKSNIDTLSAAGVIPAGYKHLTPSEKAAIEGLSASEVTAIIGTKTKLGPKFFAKHASHGMVY